MSIAFLSRHEHSVRNLSENTDSVASGEISVQQMPECQNVKRVCCLILPVVEALAAFRAAWSPVLRTSTASVKIAALGRHPHDAGFQLVNFDNTTSFLI